MRAIFIASAVAFLSYSMFPPLLPLYALSLGATPAAVGALVALLFLPPIIIAIPLGRLTDSIGPKPVFLAGNTLLVFAPILLLVDRNIAYALAFQASAGLAQVLIVISGQAAVAATSEGSRRERAFGWYTTSVSVGQMIGPLVAGIVADALGFEYAFGLALLFAAVSLLVAKLLLTSAQPHFHGDKHNLSQQAFRKMLAQPEMKIAVIASTSILGGIAAFQTFMPIYLDTLAFPATTSGLFFSLVSITAVLIRPSVDRVNAAVGNTSRTLLVVILVFAAGTAIPSLGSSFPALLAMSVLLGLGSGISQPLSMALTVQGMPISMQGVALGLRLMANRIAQFLSPLLLGLVAEIWSVRLVFPTAALIIILLGAGPIFKTMWKKRLGPAGL